jgi:hypothetical protein
MARSNNLDGPLRDIGPEGTRPVHHNWSIEQSNFIFTPVEGAHPNPHEDFPSPHNTRQSLKSPRVDGSEWHNQPVLAETNTPVGVYSTTGLDDYEVVFQSRKDIVDQKQKTLKRRQQNRAAYVLPQHAHARPVANV